MEVWPVSDGASQRHLAAPNPASKASDLHPIVVNVEGSVQFLDAEKSIRSRKSHVFQINLPTNFRAFRGSSRANVERKNSRALHVWLNHTHHTNVYGALRGEVWGGSSVEGNAALYSKRCAGAANLGRLDYHDRMRVIGANRACRTDLKRLVARVQRWNCKVGLNSRLVLQGALQRCVKFGLAVEAIREAWQVHCEKLIDLYGGGVNCSLRVVIAAEIHGAMHLNRCVCELGIRSQISTMIGHMNFCFHCGD